MSATESFTVTWPEVHQYAVELAARLGVDLSDRLPTPGTLAWLRLPDDDPVKRAALLQVASQRILHLSIEQEARAEASKAVAASADWPKVAQEVRQLADARSAGIHIPRAVTQ